MVNPHPGLVHPCLYRPVKSVSIKESAHLWCIHCIYQNTWQGFFLNSSSVEWGGTDAVGVLERVLRKIYEPKTDKITGYCIMRSSPNIIRVIRSRIIRWPGQPTSMGKRIAPYRVLMGKPEGKRPLLRRRLEDNIKMHLEKIRWGCGLY